MENEHLIRDWREAWKAEADASASWKTHALDLRLRVEELTRLLEMAREEIAWLREQLPGTPVVSDQSDGSEGAGTMGP